MIECVFPYQNKRYENLKEMMDHIRKFKKDSIINAGLSSIKACNEKESKITREQQKMIECFGTRVILLALATANNFREKTLDQQKFYDFCNDYVNIPDPLISKEEILKESKKLKNSQEKIPEEFLNRIDEETLMSIYVFKSHNLQISPNHLAYILPTSWKIFLEFSKKKDGKYHEIIEQALGIAPLYFIRSCFAIFSLGLKTGGFIKFSLEKPSFAGKDIPLTSFETDFAEKFGINTEICQNTAFKISISEKTLKDNWLKERVENLTPNEQKYFPNPLAKQPLIYMDKSFKHNQVFIMPSPQMFFYAISNYLFYLSESKVTDFNAKLGDVIEDHIGFALKKIFGNDKVHKIEKPKEKIKFADFAVELEKCVLMIDVKKQIAPYDSRSIMGARNIAKMWGGNYKACQQLASTLKTQKHLTQEKTLIPIVIYYDLFETEYFPFQLFAERSGLFKRLGIEFMEAFSWPKFEAILASTSLRKFERELLRRYDNAKTMKAGDIMDFIVEPDEKPAHSYEYLKPYEDEILNRKNPCP